MRKGPFGIRWVRAVLSADCPLTPITRLVLAGVFAVIDWESGRNYFEGSRALAARLGLNKDTVANHLTLAVEAGYLTRTPRATKGNLTRRGFTYALRLPSPVSDDARHTVSDQTGQTGTRLCPVPAAPVSDFTRQCVRPGRTDSPPIPLRTHRSADAPTGLPARKPKLRDALMSAARRSYERPAFEADFPEAVEPLHRIGGWKRLGASNPDRDLPRLIDMIVTLVRSRDAA